MNQPQFVHLLTQVVRVHDGHTNLSLVPPQRGRQLPVCIVSPEEFARMEAASVLIRVEENRGRVDVRAIAEALARAGQAGDHAPADELRAESALSPAGTDDSGGVAGTVRGGDGEHEGHEHRRGSAARAAGGDAAGGAVENRAAVGEDSVSAFAHLQRGLEVATALTRGQSHPYLDELKRDAFREGYLAGARESEEKRRIVGCQDGHDYYPPRLLGRELFAMCRRCGNKQVIGTEER